MMQSVFWTVENIEECFKEGTWLRPPVRTQWAPKQVSVYSIKRTNPRFEKNKICIIRREKNIKRAIDDLSDSKKTGGCIIIGQHLVNKAEDLLEIDMPVFVIPYGVRALTKMAQYRRKKFRGDVLCITGTAGKTTTRDLVYRILSENKITYQNRANWNFKDHVFEDKWLFKIYRALRPVAVE